MTDPGLCALCLHSKTVRGARSEFWLCERARLDPRFPRYPRLPVTSCVGFEAVRGGPATDADDGPSSAGLADEV